MKPEISILLCVYNAENYIIESLNSIKKQTFTNFEVVLINDGSTDNSLSIIENYISKNSLDIKLYSQKNKGLTKSLNKAIELSKGQFVARMDADDISHPDRLMKCLDYIKNGKYDFICTKAKSFGERERIISPPNSIKRRCFFSMTILKFGNPFVHGTFFGKREVFKENLYDEQFKTAQDYEFLCRIISINKYKFGFLNETLYFLRILPSSLGRAEGSSQVKNAKLIAEKYFGTRFYLIPASKGFKRLFLSIYKRAVF